MLVLSEIVGEVGIVILVRLEGMEYLLLIHLALPLCRLVAESLM
jgi:hypothetical protein